MRDAWRAGAPSSPTPPVPPRAPRPSTPPAPTPTRSACEFLSKLDLTVNFIPVEEFEASIDHLRPLLHLKELFLMGNPCTEWAGCRAFAAAALPQLQQLDGSDIARSERILAQQAWRGLRGELRAAAAAARAAATSSARPASSACAACS